MLNQTLHEAGSGFAGNIIYPAQSQTEIPNRSAEAVSSAPDFILAEKHGNEIHEEPNKPTENLYFCHHLTGGAAHPGNIVETAGLANIKPPRPVHRPRLPVDLITSGKISQIQLERIIYAGQAHAQKLPESNARAGISIGDGTGADFAEIEATLSGCVDDEDFECDEGDVDGDCVGDCLGAVDGDCTGDCAGAVSGDCTGTCPGDVDGDCTGTCGTPDADDDADDDDDTGDSDDGDAAAEVAGVRALPSTGAGPRNAGGSSWLLIGAGIFAAVAIGARRRGQTV